MLIYIIEQFQKRGVPPIFQRNLNIHIFHETKAIVDFYIAIVDNRHVQRNPIKVILCSNDLRKSAISDSGGKFNWPEGTLKKQTFTRAQVVKLA